ARHRSLRRAAVELGITQPSLSAQLKTLEEALGVELFERSRGGVALTPIGRNMLTEARLAVNAAEAISEAARFASRGPPGTFRLGVAPSLGPYSLPWLLPAIRQQYRGVKFFVREEVTTALIEGLKLGEHDLIFTPMPLEHPALTVVPLFREPVYLVLPAEHALAKQASIKPAQLEGLDILTIDEHHLFFKQV